MQNLSAQDPQKRSQQDQEMLDISQLAVSGNEVSGQVPASQMLRTGVTTDWRVEVKHLPESGRYQLHLCAQAQIPLQCQRCLQAFVQQVQVDRWFLLIQGDEVKANGLDEQEEMDVLAFNGRFNLLDLLEDELILETPFAPMHVQCPMPLPTAGADTKETQGQVATSLNPFAVLSQLNTVKRPQRKP